MSIAILDVDGTLVDTNYQHALAWYRAFRGCGIVLPMWRIHRHIGMGGDQMVAALAGEDTERAQGDEIREAEGGFYDAMIGEVEPMDGARELVEALAAAGHEPVLASSAKQHEVEHYLELLGLRDTELAWTSSADVEATKPAPDLVESALAKAGGGEAVMVGDSVWDVEAAARADVPTLGVLTGGFARAELLEAGASDVFESVDELVGRIAATPLGRR